MEISLFLCKKKKMQDFKLIDGTFIASDAMDVLLSMVNHKIQYHDLQVFKMMEQFKKDGVELHIDRLTELKEMREELRLYIETMGGLNCKFRVKTTITLEPLVSEKVSTEQPSVNS
jgi:predicted component of type VI protein secretion system